VENQILEQLEKLKSEDPAERRSAIEELMFEELDDISLKAICDKVADSDRGVRSAVSLAIMNNTSEKIPYYITPYVASTDIAVRNLAGELLIQQGSNSLEALIEFLPKGNDDDIKFIVDVMGLIGDDRVGEDVINELNKSENENVILACLECFGNLKYVPAVDKLVEYYPKNELYKPTIIEALGKIGSQQALEFMFSVFNEEDDLTKFSILESFGLIGDENTFFFLLSQLNIQSGPITWPIISSIYSLKTKYNFDVPFDEKMKNALLQTILDADKKYKTAAVYLVAEFDDKDLIIACLSIYGSDFELDDCMKSKFMENPEIIFPNVAAVLESKESNTGAILALVQEMIEINPASLEENLSVLNKRNLTDVLTKCIENPDEEVRRIAFELLFEIDEETAYLFLDVIVYDDNIWNRLKLLELIENNEREETVEALNKLANDPDEIVRERAEEILEQRSNPNIIKM
jgi:HEAT repeat protein